MRAFVLAVAFMAAVSGLAHADVIPDDPNCTGLSAGSSCKDGTGVCQQGTCYGSACLKCVPTATATATATTTATATSTTKDDDKDSSGCSVSGARTIAPWLLAGVFAACMTLLRRRPRR